MVDGFDDIVTKMERAITWIGNDLLLCEISNTNTLKTFSNWTKTRKETGMRWNRIDIDVYCGWNIIVGVT